MKPNWFLVYISNEFLAYMELGAYHALKKVAIIITYQRKQLNDRSLIIRIVMGVKFTGFQSKVYIG